MNVGKKFPARLIRLQCRFQSSKTWIGPKFKSNQEIRDYLAKETWSVDEYLADSQNDNLEPPSQDTVRKLLKLSGLSIKGNDVSRIQNRLGKQLSFINKLHEIRIEDEVSMDESKARLMPREGAALNYEDLLDKIASQRKNPDLGEVEGKWDSTGVAKIKERNSFVIRGGLMHDRN